MTDTPSSSLDQSQQIEGKVPISPSHISDEISTPEPPKVKTELKTICAQLVASLRDLYANHPRAQIRQLKKSHHIGLRLARYHRVKARIQAAQLVILDTATVSDISHLVMMSDCEKQALDAYHAMLKFMRADINILNKIKELSHDILALTDGAPDGRFSADQAQIALEDVQKEHRAMIVFLRSLQRYSI